jgi:hypothetical protein
MDVNFRMTSLCSKIVTIHTSSHRTAILKFNFESYWSKVLAAHNHKDTLSGMTAWVHISTTSESALTHSACYATSVNPRTETTWDNVPHWLIEQSVSDTGRPGQKLCKTDCTPFLLLLLLL